MANTREGLWTTYLLPIYLCGTLGCVQGKTPTVEFYRIFSTNPHEISWIIDLRVRLPCEDYSFCFPSLHLTSLFPMLSLAIYTSLALEPKMASDS